MKPHRGEAVAFRAMIIAVLFAAFIALAAWLVLKGD
jgi:hypothetical protein